MIFDEGGKFQCVLVFAAYTVIDGDKAYIVSSEYLHRISYLEIISSPPCHIFHNDNADFPTFYIAYHLRIGGAVKEPTAFIIVYVNAVFDTMGNPNKQGLSAVLLRRKPSFFMSIFSFSVTLPARI